MFSQCKIFTLWAVFINQQEISIMATYNDIFKITHNDILPAQGSILISEPFLQDAYFQRSVVLLVEHAKEGSMGFVLNKKTDLAVNSFFSDLDKIPDMPIFLGGPVSSNRLFFIHSLGDLILPNAIKINEHLYFDGNFDALLQYIRNGHPVEGKITFFDLDPAGIGFVFNLNFLGTLLPSQVFCREMALKGGGIVINISSMNAFKPLTKIPAYSAAKAAISNFTQWLATHMSGVNIRVNAIAPGFFLTNQNRTLLTNPDGSLTVRGNTIIAHTPMGRFGTPEDLIGTLLWLVDNDASGFVNGTVIPVDGGFSAFSGV